MFVKLIAGGYSFDDKITDQKVIATSTGENGGIDVRMSELLRVGLIDSEYVNGFHSSPKENLSDTRLFLEGEYEVVQPTMVNCSDSNVGKGWDGFYDQQQTKRSKFRG